MVEKARAMVRKIEVTPARGGDGGLPSPTSPLDRAAAPSPRGWRNRDAGGVGLGILAALEARPAAPVAIAIASPRRAARLEVSELGCSGRCPTSFCGGASASSFSSSSSSTTGGAAFRVADFLTCCHLCRRRLDGQDIYMYRGEKAFCSMECRYQAIVTEEFHEEEEKHGGVEIPANAAAAADIAGSPYAAGRIFFTGIVAA